jgi:excisionase family DNA binding protein
MRTINKTILDRRANLTDVEVAEYLNISSSTVRRWRLNGGGPRWVRLAGSSSIRYPIADLEAYVANSPSGGGHQTEAA